MVQCVTLWIGKSLGPVERACLRSVLSQGHRLALYCYDEPQGIPAGIEVRDASAILPESSVVRHQTGSVALFSDWFRYELQRRGAGTWVDADIYLVAPLDADRPFLFGEQEPGVINNAVLRVPADSAILDGLLKPFQMTTPPWLPVRHRLLSRVRERITGVADVASMPWGTTGPAALTAMAAKLGLSSHALPPTVFYPMPWQRADWIRDPSVRLADVVTDETVAVHLWNECIRHFKDEPGRKGSFLRRLQEEGEEGG